MHPGGRQAGGLRPQGNRILLPHGCHAYLLEAWARPRWLSLSKPHMWDRYSCLRYVIPTQGNPGGMILA